MQNFSKCFEEEEDGFCGSYDAYLIDTNKENLANFLRSNIDDDGRIYEAIKKEIDSILVIKNLNIDKEFQGQGYGSEILSEVLNESYAQAAILMCDIMEGQLPGFILEKFYESHDFKTIETYQDYPVMIYPESLANKIIENLKPKKSLKP